ncbi:hypothetical protein TI39_contig4159g00040 [Zymoseptoria brevis]|uniref:PLAC8 family protein n=1 Tax=Zymoseptoria brevis TaxID=1047168 RepID=A0A0F4GBM0_9PEZI|nr:hypothetical protein TI39_contig4159g00040 [Zymoseptoria brevis]
MSRIPQQQTGEWEGGFCDGVCGGDCGTCMGSWFCACFLHGRVSSRFQAFPAEDDSMLNSSCLFWYLGACCGFQWVPQLLRRQEIRQTFGIQGSDINDCCVSFWCTPCTLAQMNIEVKKRAEKARLMAASSDAGYKSEAGMSYAPPPQQTMGEKQEPMLQSHPNNVAQGPVGA